MAGTTQGGPGSFNFHISKNAREERPGWEHGTLAGLEGPGERDLPQRTERRDGRWVVILLRPHLCSMNPHPKEWLLLDSGHPTHHGRNFRLAQEVIQICLPKPRPFTFIKLGNHVLSFNNKKRWEGMEKEEDSCVCVFYLLLGSRLADEPEVYTRR